MKKARASVWLALAILSLCGSGCASFYTETTYMQAARIVSWGGTDYVKLRKTPKNPLEGPLQLVSASGPQPTARTLQILRENDLEQAYEADAVDGLSKLAKLTAGAPDLDKLYAFAELAYVTGKRADARYDHKSAFDLYLAGVVHAQQYLVHPAFDERRNPFDPQFRAACDLYNASLEGALRIVRERGELRPGQALRVETCGQVLELEFAAVGRWSDEDFDRFEFVSDYELAGLNNHHVTYGLGVPLIAIRKKGAASEAIESHYPRNLTIPVTAVMQVASPLKTESGSLVHRCRMSFIDPGETTEIVVGGKRILLESDLSTPLAYFLNDPLLKSPALSTIALIDANYAQNFRGLYMLEPFDPNRIPVLMVHGLWSNPVTWSNMFNDLRAQPEIRSRYQFWFYLYPTGQPFWISAQQLREDLREVRATFDPGAANPNLSRMVLVGHSMGGLVSKMQTIESGDAFWKTVCDKPFEELQAEDATKAYLRNVLFFAPDPTIRRVVTLGTPHRGSEFANPATRWLGKNLLRLPTMLTESGGSLVSGNPGFFRDTKLLTIETSIDSLAPDSPIFPAMLAAPKAPWITYHNVLGVVPQEGLLGALAGEGDGIVSRESAHVENAASEIVIPADHAHVHQHPLAVLEVRRILMEHAQEYERQERRTYAPALNLTDRDLYAPAMGRQAQLPTATGYPVQAPAYAPGMQPALMR